MRVLFTGSRNWEGGIAEQRIWFILQKLEDLSVALGSQFVIVHGGCPSGADAVVDRWARRRDYEPEVHPADWATHGKAAGPIRNVEMVTDGADLCIGFLRDGSRGTKDCLTVARVAGIPTFTIHWNQGGEGVDQDH